MYRKESRQLSFEDTFYLPFGGSLRSDNRWVILAKVIPWHAIEEKYANLFSEVGQPAKPIRMSLGALIIQEKNQYSDLELVEQITENPYLQYFLGLKQFQTAPLFDSSVLVRWRRRFTKDVLIDVNEMIVAAQKELKKKPPNDKKGPPDNNGGQSCEAEKTVLEKQATNEGKLMLDATCAPADIKYPTDVSLLNDAREKLEEMIDVLHLPLAGTQKKPRTRRQQARKAYLRIAKQKRPQSAAIRKAIGQQLRFVRRDLQFIEQLQEYAHAGVLSKRQKRYLVTIKKLYEQQNYMYQNRTHQVEDRIVSIHQPHVRPIVRGKARSFTEFGAKVEASIVDGFSFLEQLSWDAFNEATGLKEAVEKYRQRYGCYPEAILADRLYRNRENLAYCKELGIRLSGPKLGRPAKVAGDEKQLAIDDNRKRNAIEGKFGEGKRIYGLNRIMARLPETSACVIAMQFLVMNLAKILRDFCAPIWRWIMAVIFNLKRRSEFMYFENQGVLQ